MKSFAAAILAFFGLMILPPSHAGAEELLAHVDAAERLVRELEPQNNEYAYKDPFIKWKGDPGVDQSSARCDCSAFVTLLLQHTYGYSPEYTKKWMGRALPLARVFHDQIEAAHGFIRIERIDQMKRGDIIAIRYLPDSRAPGMKDTGHVLIIAEAPSAGTTPDPAKPPATTTSWDVVVIDSSKSGHGPTDTRRRPDKTFGTGVGRGTLRLYGDTDGKIAGYSWSTLQKSEFWPPDKHHVVVGRLDPGFTP